MVDNIHDDIQVTNVLKKIDTGSFKGLRYGYPVVTNLGINLQAMYMVHPTTYCVVFSGVKYPYVW